MVQAAKKSICQMCHARCRVLVYSENGRLTRIEEDPSDPRVNNIFPPTRACLRLRGCAEWLYHPDRINFPLKRGGERERPSEEAGSRRLPGQCHLKGGCPGKLLSPSRRRKIVKRVHDKLMVSKRRACDVLEL